MRDQVACILRMRCIMYHNEACFHGSRQWWIGLKETVVNECTFKGDPYREC